MYSNVIIRLKLCILVFLCSDINELKTANYRPHDSQSIQFVSYLCTTRCFLEGGVLTDVIFSLAGLANRLLSASTDRSSYKLQISKILSHKLNCHSQYSDIDMFRLQLPCACQHLIER
jgi:hypothetical protein